MHKFLRETNPELKIEWNDEKNLPLVFDKVTFMSNAKVWWTCKKCGYEWRALISNRSKGNGCPRCTHRVVYKGVDDLATTDPVIAAEWDRELNDPLTAADVSRGSRKKVGWVCKICGYIYEGDPLPEDFICPICKHPASDFEKLK